MENEHLNIFQRNAKVVVLCGVVAGSMSGIIGRMIDAPSMVIGFYRLLLALPFFIIPVLVKYRPELFAIKKKELILALVSGFFLFAHFLTWFIAIKETEIASALVLVSLNPLVVVFMTYFVWKQRVSLKAVIGIGIAILGGVIVVGGNFSGGGSMYGDMMAFISCLGIGVYFSIGTVVRQKVVSAVYLCIVFGMCFLCFALATVITSTPVLGYSTESYFWMVVMMLVCQLGAHAVFNWSMAYVPSLYVSAVDTGEIVVGALMALLLFAEIPTVWQITGGIVVIIGLLYYNYHEQD